MKKIILKLFSILVIIIGSIILINNSYDFIISLINLIKYQNKEELNIIIIAILRLLLYLFLIIYSIFLIKNSIKILKVKKDIEEKPLKKLKHKTIILLVVGLILQILSISDFTTNITLCFTIILETLELIFFTNSKIWTRIQIFFIFNYILVIVLLISFSFLFCHKYELPTNKTGTSTKASVNTNYYEEIWKMTTNSEFFHATFQNKKEKNNYNMIPIPGINYTDTVTTENSLRLETCTSMTPQGLVITDNYIYISAYCHTHVHNSVIYQIDRKTRKYIKTIVLPDANHVGGLAYDSDNNILWIATKKYNTDNDDDKLATVSCITQDVIDNYNFSITRQPIRYYKTYQTAFKNTSFITYHDHYLYTGVFTENEEETSIAAKLEIKDDGDIIGTSLDTEPIAYYYIPSRVQSIAFINNKILFVTSYGVDSSKIKIYNNTNEAIDFINQEPLKEIITPQKLEQIYPYNNQIYMVFESSAYAYRYTPGIVMDHIISIKKDFIN